MAIACPPANKESRAARSRFGDEDGFDTEFDSDLVRLLEENARLRALVAQLSTLVLRHVAEQK